MVHHVILWKLKESISKEEKKSIADDIKLHLEALVGVVPGLKSLEIVINEMSSSNADVMLNSVFESVEDLKGYQKHPAHVEAANGYVRPYTELRLCMDYQE